MMVCIVVGTVLIILLIFAFVRVYHLGVKAGYEQALLDQQPVGPE